MQQHQWASCLTVLALIELAVGCGAAEIRRLAALSARCSEQLFSRIAATQTLLQTVFSSACPAATGHQWVELGVHMRGW